MAHHLLIVEDEEMLARLLALQLEKEGYRVTTVGSGGEMLETLVAEEIDLVLLDLGLPDGDGLSLVHAVRDTSTVPIVVSTARKGDSDRDMALGLGVNAYMTKPLEVPELVKTIDNILGVTRAARDGGHDTAAVDEPAAGNLSESKASGARPSHKTTTHWRLMAVSAAVIVGGSIGLFMFIDQEVPDTASAPLSVPNSPPDPAPGNGRGGESGDESGGGADTPTTPGSTSSNGAKLSPFETLMRTPAPEPPHEVGTRNGERDGGTRHSSPAAPVAPVTGAEQRHFAEVLGFGWVLNSQCGELPSTKYWRIKDSVAAAGHVQRSYQGNWAPYVTYWEKRTANLKAIDAAGLTARLSTGDWIGGAELKAYLATMEKRLETVRCLATEAAAATK